MTEVNDRDLAVTLLRTTLMAFAAREDVYIPRQADLSEFLYERALRPIVADAIRLAEEAIWLVEAQENGNVMYCTTFPGPHDTHMWTWETADVSESGRDIRVRCPGRD
jgi:hypothetical protein